ncbi:MAG: SDR family oxidoreductase [Bacteroidia bacterium]|nr:SDR family oxidoreductase [Bacteroidia bacterium]
MDLYLENKVMIVTGGERGIGEGIVRGMVAEGGTVVIAGRVEPDGKKLAQDLTTNGGKCFFIHSELTQPGQCERIIDLTLEKYGRIDILVNNAGVNDRVSLEKGNHEDFMRSFDENVSHYYSMAHFALKALKVTRGTIINISSKTGLTGQGGNSGYVSAKAAQLGLTRDWAIELLPFGIRVNAVLPAEVMTPMYINWLNGFENPGQKLKAITDRIPLGKRMTTTQEIADMVLFLASERASHITGQFLHVDGGYVHLDRAL